MTVSEYYTSGAHMLSYYLHHTSLALVLNVIHHRYPCFSIDYPHYPSQLWEVAHVTPSLLADKCFINVHHCSLKSDILFDFFFNVSADRPPNDNVKIRHHIIVDHDLGLAGIAIVRPESYRDVELDEIKSLHGCPESNPLGFEATRANPMVLIAIVFMRIKSHLKAAKSTVSPWM